MSSVNLSSLVTGTLVITQKSLVRFLPVPGAGGGILDRDEAQGCSISRGSENPDSGTTQEILSRILQTSHEETSRIVNYSFSTLNIKRHVVLSPIHLSIYVSKNYECFVIKDHFS